MLSFSRIIFSLALVFCVGVGLARHQADAASSGIGVGLTIAAVGGFTLQWVVPEGRVGAAGTNWSTNFALTTRLAGNPSSAQTSPSLLTTDEAGAYATPLSFSVVGGQPSEIFIKTDQHLAKKLTLTLPGIPGTTTLNFTQADNSAPLGLIRLLAGDVNGAGTTPATLGDNVVNAVDLSIMLNHLDETDPSTKSIRSNLNRDPVVNATDLSLLLKNLDVEGDH